MKSIKILMRLLFPNKTKTLFPSKNNIYFANQERNYKILENQTLTKKLMTLFPNF